MLNMATTIALVGLHYLPHSHKLYVHVNITAHVCKGLEVIGAYIACALLTRLAWLAAVLINTYLVIVLFKDTDNLK